MTVTAVHLDYIPASNERSGALAEVGMLARQYPGLLSIESLEYSDGEIIRLDADPAENQVTHDPLTLTIHRDHDGIWFISGSSGSGVYHLRYQANPAVMLAELLQTLGTNGAGNWLLVNYDTGAVI